MPLTFQHSYDQHQSLTKFQFTLEIKSHQLCHMNTLALLQKISPKENKWNSNISLNGKTS